jgi:type VI secretion system protein ImpH
MSVSQGPAGRSPESGEDGPLAGAAAPAAGAGLSVSAFDLTVADTALPRLRLPAAARPAVAPVDRLAAEPGRFSLDQAAAIAAPDDDVMALRFRTVARLGYPNGEILQNRPNRRELVVSSFGLIGPGGTLARHHTATIAAELRKRGLALHSFVDMLAGRFTGHFVLAGAKYRPTRNPVPASRALAAAAGFGTPHLHDRSGVALATLLYHAGNLASRSRSATRLQALLAEETGSKVEILEFQGGWIRLPPEEQSRLAGNSRGKAGLGQHAGLGTGAAAGAQTWDSQARFVIRIGPLTRAEFEAIMPGMPRHDRIMALARLFVGQDTGFAINPVLAAAEIPAARLGQGARMGWSTWMAAASPRKRDGEEARFEGR